MSTIIQLGWIDRPSGLPDEVAARLTALIRDGVLRPGDRLPTEQSLASQAGVARTVVREAIARLKYDGLVSSRQGKGAFVAHPDDRAAFRIGPACFAKRQQLMKLLQLRTGVSADAAGLAARHRTAKQLAVLRERFADMQQSIERGRDHAAERVDAEAAFYRAVAEASANEYLVEFITMLDTRILRELRSVAVKNAMTAEWGGRVLEEHRAVLQAIADRNADAADRATRHHYEDAARRLADRADLADI